MSLLLRAVPEWLELVSLSCCVGVFVCSLWVVDLTRGDTVGADGLLPPMRQLLGIGVTTLFATSILGLLVRAAEMSGYPMTGVFPVLPTVLLRTHLGHAWVLRIAAVLALCAATIAGRALRPSRLVQGSMLACTLVVSAMNSASGHAADTGDFSVAEIMDWIHLVGAMAWGGGLLVLSLAILPRLAKQGDGAASSMATIAARFSRIAAVGAALIVVTAPYEEWRYGGSLEALVDSPYGRTIIAKIILFLSLLILGAFNRYASVARLLQWAGSVAAGHGAPLDAPALSPSVRDVRGRLAAVRFTRTVQLEAFLLVAVLLCAAMLRHEAPSRHSAHLEHHAVQTYRTSRAIPISMW